MKDNVRARIIMAIALLVIVPWVIVIMITSSFGSGKEMNAASQQKRMAEYVEKLNQRNVDVIFYKKDPIGPDNLKARRVNALNDTGLALNLYSDRAFHVIIFDDLDGSLFLNDQDIQKLKDLLNNKHFRIVYLGTMHYKQLVDNEILIKNANHKDGNKTYLTFYSKNNIRSNVEGTAFADDPMTMPITSGLTEEQTIIYTVIVELAHKDLYWS
ncbi:MAG: hypothetical protein IKW88_05295 [Clostridiales bacterium]|nr:hypothetical protein [Clostridiales bacterium]